MLPASKSMFAVQLAWKYTYNYGSSILMSPMKLFGGLGYWHTSVRMACVLNYRLLPSYIFANEAHEAFRIRLY